MSDDSDIRTASVSSVPPKKTVSVKYNPHTIVIVLVFILVAVLAFGLGVAYGRHSKSSSTSTTTFSRGQGQFGGGGFGTVSAISSSSITVENARTGSSKTYSITSSTKITDGGQSASISSISDGDRVIVMPTSSGGSVAGTILVNPSFGGGFGGSSQSTNGSNTSTNGSTTSGSAAGSTTTTQ